MGLGVTGGVARGFRPADAAILGEGVTMPQHTRWSRREFLQTAAVTGAGAILVPRALAGQAFVPAVGVTGSITEAGTLKSAGFDYLEGGVGAVLMPDKPETEFEVLLAQLKTLPLPVLACNVFLPAALKIVGPQADHDAAATYAETALRRAGVAGIGTIVFGSGGARKVPDGFDATQARDQFIAFGKRIAPASGKAGVVLALEPLNRKETNFINSVAEGAAIVDAVAHPAFRLHADVYHMLQEDEPPEAITAAGARIVHVHVAQRGTRLAPMPGGTDFRPCFTALKGIGYRGRISIEAGWKDGETDFARSRAFIREQWTAA
jgi:sugar phosphate isomerase/epimerase